LHKKYNVPTTDGGGDEDDENDVSTMRGFTLSYLRRVPELSDMARRVVKAEAKRRLKEDKKNGKDVGRGKDEFQDKQNIGPKMKRLFGWAIVKLYEEGNIVLWEGPVRALPATPEPTSRLWNAHSTCTAAATTTTLGADSAIFLSVSGTATTAQAGYETEYDEITLSDPQPNEEAYIPLTASYLAQHVEKAIDTLISRSLAEESRAARATATSVAQRQRQNPRAPASGPTKEEIALFLRRSDERWARVGVWAVDEALDFLRREGRAWVVGQGRWELCL
jgi:hypothetical protein